jgi:putative membrane protein
MRFGHGYQGMNGMHYGGFMIVPCIIITLILLIVLVYLFNKLIRKKDFHGNIANTTSLPPVTTVDTTAKALEILNIRYANGEITEEEYNLKKQNLSLPV